MKALKPLPPFWALGYITSRYGYHSSNEAQNVVSRIIVLPKMKGSHSVREGMKVPRIRDMAEQIIITAADMRDRVMLDRMDMAIRIAMPDRMDMPITMVMHSAEMFRWIRREDRCRIVMD